MYELSSRKYCSDMVSSGNVLTSIVVDQGRMRIPTKTVIGNQVFLGNTNHISEGLPNGTFCGLHTWVPTKPTVPGENFFGNPAMKFGRPSSHGSEAPPSRRQVFWYHFSTSVVDIFFWDILKAQEWALAFMISTSCFKGSDSWPVLVFEVLIFAAMPVIFWFLMHIVFCNRIYNDRCPLSNDFYSGVVMRWFNANKIRRIFQSPFMAGGTMWQAPLMRLVGIHVGARFFATGEDVMIDPPFGRIGDDVTFDYDAQVRQHSFEDRKLKWGPNWVGSGTTILQGGCLAMSDAGEGVVLRHSSVTWKGQLLEPNQDYEGAPAVAVAEA
ncbi:unnamed protein product [Polarella glacialis]|uniref:Uncharacterized protein n=1 Tax=Polarella glacialis TaxID=89957 RepID=A0A813FXD0_POLGL|nr:unnamed protein product [Polarella glacialis]